MSASYILEEGLAVGGLEPFAAEAAEDGIVAHGGVAAGVAAAVAVDTPNQLVEVHAAALVVFAGASNQPGVGGLVGLCVGLPVAHLAGLPVGHLEGKCSVAVHAPAALGAVEGYSPVCRDHPFFIFLRERRR